MHTQTHLYIHKCTYNESITKANAATLVLSFFWISNYFALAFIALFVVYSLFLLFTCCVWFFFIQQVRFCVFSFTDCKKNLDVKIVRVLSSRQSLCMCECTLWVVHVCVCVCFECNLSFCVQLITSYQCDILSLV